MNTRQVSSLLVLAALGPLARVAECGTDQAIAGRDVDVRSGPRSQADRHRTFSLGEVPPGVQNLLTDIVRDNIPVNYEDTKHWGTTKEVVRGLQLRREGLRIETKRRRKRVNHGTWRMYRISLIDPEENLEVRIQNLHDAGAGNVGFDVVVAAKLRVFGRMSQWQRGLQLISLSADAVADVELRTQCQLGMMLDPSSLPPDVVLKPRVVDAALVAHSFQLERISKAKGPLATEFGHSLHRVLNRRLDEKREKIVEKINRQIVKRADRLRFSPREMMVPEWLDAVITHGVDSQPQTEPDGNLRTQDGRRAQGTEIALRAVPSM